MRRLERRSDRLRFALTALYLAFTVVRRHEPDAGDRCLCSRTGSIALPTFLAVVGVGLLLFASVNLVLETLSALKSNRLETRFYHDLHELRHGGGSRPGHG